MSSVAVAGIMAEVCGRSKLERGTARLAVALERTMSEGPYSVRWDKGIWTRFGYGVYLDGCDKCIYFSSVQKIAQSVCDALNAAHSAGAAGKAELVEACEFSLANYRRMLESERTCGSPHVGDDEHEAIRLLTAALAKAK